MSCAAHRNNRAEERSSPAPSGLPLVAECEVDEAVRTATAGRFHRRVRCELSSGSGPRLWKEAQRRARHAPWAGARGLRPGILGRQACPCLRRLLPLRLRGDRRLWPRLRANRWIGLGCGPLRPVMRQDGPSLCVRGAAPWRRPLARRTRSSPRRARPLHVRGPRRRSTGVPLCGAKAKSLPCARGRRLPLRAGPRKYERRHPLVHGCRQQPPHVAAS